MFKTSSNKITSTVSFTNIFLEGLEIIKPITVNFKSLNIFHSVLDFQQNKSISQESSKKNLHIRIMIFAELYSQYCFLTRINCIQSISVSLKWISTPINHMKCATQSYLCKPMQYLSLIVGLWLQLLETQFMFISSLRIIPWRFTFYIIQKSACLVLIRPTYINLNDSSWTGNLSPG